MDELPEAYSLSRVQADLAGSKQYPEIEATIRRAQLTQSCHADMKEAVDCVTALKAMRSSARGWRSRNREATEGALFRTAINLYTRATKSNSRKPGDRGPSQITADLSPIELADHEAIVAVRDQVQAHVYLNRPVHGHTWHISEAFLVRQDAGWAPGVASNRTILTGNLLSALDRQVPRARQILEHRGRNNLDAVVKAIVKAAGPEIDALVGRARFDLVELFGSVESAQRAIAGIGRGFTEWTTGR